MKYLSILIILLLFSCSVNAQITVGNEFTNEVVTMKNDTLPVTESFKLLDKICKGLMWHYDRVVISNGVTYLKFGFSFNRNRVYFLEGKKFRRVHI